MLYFLINNKAILIRSMLAVAAGVVQDTFVGEAVEGEGRSPDMFAGEAVQGEGGEEKTTGGYFYCYFYWYCYRLG